MLLLVGLGNPGREHAGNRHNVGFMAVDAIIRRHGFSAPRARPQLKGVTAEGMVDGEKIVALQPQTYMNVSGESVGAAMRFWKLAPEDVTVIYDEIDLFPGKVRVKRGGGSGGHNGIRSIDAHIGADYRRVRIGVGHPGTPELVAHWVLRDFAKSDHELWLDKTLEAIAEAWPFLVRGDDAGFMNKVALLTQPPRPKKPPPENAPGGGTRTDKTDSD
jgi:PTH1 family peptidyl-tRNA hydrolase